MKSILFSLSIVLSLISYGQVDTLVSNINGIFTYNPNLKRITFQGWGDRWLSIKDVAKVGICSQGVIPYQDTLGHYHLLSSKSPLMHLSPKASDSLQSNYYSLLSMNRRQIGKGNELFYIAQNRCHEKLKIDTLGAIVWPTKYTYDDPQCFHLFNNAKLYFYQQNFSKSYPYISGDCKT